jgi:hypothetical protein
VTVSVYFTYVIGAAPAGGGTPHPALGTARPASVVPPPSTGVTLVPPDPVPPEAPPVPPAPLVPTLPPLPPPVVPVALLVPPPPIEPPVPDVADGALPPGPDPEPVVAVDDPPVALPAPGTSSLEHAPSIARATIEMS